MIMGHLQWLHVTQPEETLAIEASVVSDTIRTGGTIDRVYRIDGKLTVLDLKTSNAVQLSHKIQAATYAYMWEEQHGEEVDQIIILRLRELGSNKYEAKVIPRDEWLHYYSLFESAYAFWKEENPNRTEPSVLRLPAKLDLHYYEREEEKDFNEICEDAADNFERIIEKDKARETDKADGG